MVEELKKDFPINHGFLHVSHVLENAKLVAKELGLDKKETELLLVAAALHDVGYTKGREEHATNGAKLVEDFLKQSNFESSDIEQICYAIANHNGRNKHAFNNKIATALVLADKMDFVKSRYDSRAWQHESMIPFLYVEKVCFKNLSDKAVLEVYSTRLELLEFSKGNYFFDKLTSILENTQLLMNKPVEIELFNSEKNLTNE